MKILDKYLLKQFLITFTTVFVILFFIFVLQGIWNFPFMAAYLVARFHKIPYIVFTHGTFNPESFHGNSTWIKKISYALSVKRMLMDANHVFFTTQVEQKKLIDEALS